MVTLITEKLGRQSLDDVEFSPIDQSQRRTWEFTATDAINFTVSGMRWSVSPAAASSRGHQGACEMSTPPVKRYCHSLSDGVVAAAAATGAMTPADVARRWQPAASSVWRPFRPYSPPASPPPAARPASAASADFHDSSVSLAAYSPAHQAAPPATAFKRRSLSMEEAVGRGGCGGGCGGAGGGSMPAIPPLSPLRLRGPPRSRSQPCVQLHKAALKRRRTDHRPTIDLFKMKETSHEGFGRTRHRSLQFAPHDYAGMLTSSRCASTPGGAMYGGYFEDTPASLFGLKTIASSPLDGSTVLQPPPLPATPRGATCTTGAVDKCGDGDDDDDDDGDDDDGDDDDGDGDKVNCGMDLPDETVFSLEINGTIDLDQIEKD